jgi:DUF2075 family protein
MDFRVFDNPSDMEVELRRRSTEGNSVRLLSTYSRKWLTRDAAQPHLLPAEQRDFQETYQTDDGEHRWSRIWNFVPDNDYTWFVAGRPGSPIADDPLCEVGCPYAVRGFDFDYVGILWLNDLVWRNGEWRVDPFAVEESGVAGLTARARADLQQGRRGESYEELLRSVNQAYRILFTRALKGVYVWIPDSETEERVLSSLSR